MRDRLLIRHFLWRFLEHDLVSPDSDRRTALSAVAGVLVAVSLFVGFMVAVPYVFDNAMPAGIASILSLNDRFLLVSASMLLMALAAVGQWDADDCRNACVQALRRFGGRRIEDPRGIHLLPIVPGRSARLGQEHHLRSSSRDDKSNAACRTLSLLSRLSDCPLDSFEGRS